MARKLVGTWDGGRISEDRFGAKVYWIEKMRDLRRFAIPLKVRSEKEALAELALFTRDPHGYADRAVRAEEALAENDEGGPPVVLDVDTAGRFLAFLRMKERTEHYRRDTRRYLKEWAEKLHGRDLRRMTLRDYKTILAGWESARLQRIAAIKSFCAYLRQEEGQLTHQSDASMNLKVPQPKPRNVEERGYSREIIETIYRNVDSQLVRDLLVLRIKLGMHHTEVDRLARKEGKLVELTDYGEIAGYVVFPHKNRTIHKQSMDAQCVAAARRLQLHGQAPSQSYVYKATNAAVRAAKLDLECFQPGQLRHTCVTLARTIGTLVRPRADLGVALQDIASFVGHRSTATTRKFYDATPVEPLIKLAITLHHPEDPAPLAKRETEKATR